MLSQAESQNATRKDINVTEPEEMPTDSVSCISWTPSGKNPTFATSSWDSWIRIYNVDIEASILEQKSCFETESPCLSITWHHDETTLFAGCTDGSVKSFDVETGMPEIIGHHDGPVRSVHWLEAQNALLTLSFDKTLRFWDPRQQGSEHVAGFRLDYKPFCSDLVYPHLAVGMSEARVLYLNLEEIQSVLGTERARNYYLDSPLGPTRQITSIKLSRGQQLGIGTSDDHGRCNVSKLDFNDNGNGRPIKLNSVITWKSQQKKDEDKRTREVYPNTSFGFHPRRGLDFAFTTGGGEGQMNFWDLKKKGLNVEFDFKGACITRAEMDPTGKYLAYTFGYDWSRGIGGYMSQVSKVCVHVMQDQEIEYKYQGNEDYPLKYKYE